MKFDINNYKGKYVMHCKTEEEAKEFCEYLDSVGRRWQTAVSYTSLTNWDEETETICYNFNHGLFGSKGFYRKHNYIILEWSDFTTEFTKADLKDGMIIECANGNRYLTLGNNFINRDGFLESKGYNNDLKHIGILHKWDINKVYKAVAYNIDDIFRDDHLTLIWERKEEPEEMTLEEVCKALGKEIKIVKG